MSTIADYSVFTKAFLASTNVDFSKPFPFSPISQDNSSRAFAVVPLALDPTLTPREAMNFDWAKLGSGLMQNRVSCRDANGEFIGNIVRIQPGVREGSIRLVAKVAVPVTGEEDVTDFKVNTFVLLRTDAMTNRDLPIAVATISKGYTLHKHSVIGNDPLDDAENASYVSFTINHLNGYTSVDFNPDAYVTYDVTDALSSRVDVLEGKEGIEGLHLAFNSNTGDIILSDSKGNVIDQANLHLDLNTDTIIAEGEEGYKYVKTDRNQDIYSAKAFMRSGSNTSAFGSSDAVTYDTQHASLVREGFNGGNEGNGCNGIRVRWAEQAQEGSEQAPSHDEIFCIFLKDGNGDEGTDPNKKYLAWYRQSLLSSEPNPISTGLVRTALDTPIEVTNPDSSKIYPNQPEFGQPEPVYRHDVFVHTVGNSSLADWDEFFKLMGFHDGDDIPLGTDLPALMQVISSSKLDPEAWIHGVGSQNKENVEAQRKLAKEELVAWNKQHPALTEDRQDGTIIDSSGLDVRKGRITLGCGRKGEAGVFKKVNYGIQMKDRSLNDNIPNRSESLDFTVSHTNGEAQFDENGHATGLTSSTLLSIEAGRYISGAPTCLILAEVTHNSENEPVMFTPVRTTSGFSVASSYSTSNGLTLTIHDYRDNIIDILDPEGDPKEATAIIEVQAIYTHQDARNETVPAQQMHTYIGTWEYIEHPECSFLCNKIEEWMTAVGLADTSPAGGVELYVVIRVY